MTADIEFNQETRWYAQGWCFCWVLNELAGNTADLEVVATLRTVVDANLQFFSLVEDVTPAQSLAIRRWLADDLTAVAEKAANFEADYRRDLIKWTENLADMAQRDLVATGDRVVGDSRRARPVGTSGFRSSYYMVAIHIQCDRRVTLWRRRYFGEPLPFEVRAPAERPRGWLRRRSVPEREPTPSGPLPPLPSEAGVCDWIDQNGATYAGVVSVRPEYFDREWPFLQERVRALLTDVDHVAVDVSVFTREQGDIVRAFVKELNNPQVFVVGYQWPE